ncbi:anti-sigma factor [Arthrobacter sp. FW305-BF8]|uniref:anti-sigma factor n=1 Tax=Arthrobacter sp. FW305-BF8 TaxID=2879617 RepID=UPI001F23A373|nr:anti-sigma factor [Arthrobacter sp. FW305-BF8]UKA53049.1 anti-sigma factor [Arthrobacter sp. FW305-BF8]
MRRLHRLLEGLRQNTGFPPLAGGRHPQTPDHIRACAECASALHRQRQYIERLRAAAVPAASDELTARLLLRTQQLAMAPPPVARPSRMRLAGLAGGVAVVAAGAVAAGAYTVAGEPGQYAAGTASLYGQSGHSPGTDSRLAALRSSGWTCPELRAMGFRLVSASTTVLAGRPTVELRLTDGQHTARILEQHQGSPSALSPVNPLTGHPAGSDGYVAADLPGATADGRVWVKAGSPWSAIYQTPRSTFTYVSDLPATSADDALAVLAAPGSMAGPGLAAGTDTAGDSSAAQETVVDRVERGLRKIARQLGL